MKQFYDVIAITELECKNFVIDNLDTIYPNRELWEHLCYNKVGKRLLFSKDRLHCGQTRVNKQVNEWDKFFSIYRKLIGKPILITCCVILIPDELLKENTDLPQEQLVDFVAGHLKSGKYLMLSHEVK